MKSLRERLKEKVPPEEEFEGAITLGEPAIKQGTWLTTPLWNQFAWGITLKRANLQWQDFMEAYGNSKYSFIRWSRGEESWKDAMYDFIDQIARIR